MADAIETLKGLVERAKPTTWSVFTNRHPETNGSPWGCIEAVKHPMGGAGSSPSGMSAMTWSGESGRTNADLIVAAVNALPALLAVAEAVRDALADMAENLDSTVNDQIKDRFRTALANLETHQ